ncbi:DUF1918 domain-containing protein [Cellulomonas endophytica]|uniref:DUF1918 domain-containing protein n=1 Tax=Cellulomonas endophytica TaxID=2494735 RepID=UPI001F0C7A24|nr:DUF1918 domain-containing protein [Cellulomonas endophytica]
MVRAHVGARLVVAGRRQGDPSRDGEIIEVRGAAGGPPYLVRWSDSGHAAWCTPAPMPPSRPRVRTARRRRRTDDTESTSAGGPHASRRIDRWERRDR